MPIKGVEFLLTRKGKFAMEVLKLVVHYLETWSYREDARAEVVEVLDWIAGEVLKDEGE